VVRDAAIGTVRVRPGDRVILATFLANGALGGFDPGANAAASLKQLWFGAGSHFCLGASLAMAQVRVTLDALLAAGPLEIVSRRAARGVLIPSYVALEVWVSTGRVSIRGSAATQPATAEPGVSIRGFAATQPAAKDLP
jgi:hypothetical protein